MDRASGMFVRGLWGDHISENREKSLRDMRRQIRWPQPEPMTVYVYGEDNLQYARSIGIESTHLMGVNAISRFGQTCERNPQDNGPDIGAINYGISTWRHKLEIIKQAIKDHGSAVWIDWDCQITRTIPDDFWDRLRNGPALQGELYLYRLRQPHMSRRMSRLMFCGSCFYMRGMNVINRAIDLHRQNPEMIDQPILQAVADEMTGGWKGPEEFYKQGLGMDCLSLRGGYRTRSPDAKAVTKDATLISGR